MSTTGTGTPPSRVLFDNPDVGWLAPYDWTPDGHWIAVALRRKDHTAAVGLISVPDGSFRQLRSVEWNSVSNMALSPAGDYLAFDQRTGDDQTRDVILLAIDASTETPVVTYRTDETLVGWSPDGSRLLFVSDRSGTPGLWSIPVVNGKAAGDATLMYPNVGPFWPMGVTSSGAIWSAVITPGGSEVRLTSSDFTGPEPLAFKVLDDFAGPGTQLRWSHEGTLLAWASQWVGLRPLTPSFVDLQELRLTVRPIGGGDARPLRSNLQYVNDFDWAPGDQTLIVAGADRSGRTGIFEVNARTGSTAPIVLTPGEQTELLRWGAVTRGHLYYRRIRIASQTAKLVEHDLISGRERDVLPWAPRFFQGRPAAGPARSTHALAVTPNGQAIYLASDPTAKTLMLRSLALDSGTERELMRTSDADALSFLEWLPGSGACLISKDIKDPSRSELWRVPIDRTEPAALVRGVDDLSRFQVLGWTPDFSALILGSKPVFGVRMEMATLTANGVLTRLGVSLDAAPTSVALAPDRRQAAYRTEFHMPAAPLSVWVLEHAIPTLAK